MRLASSKCPLCSTPGTAFYADAENGYSYDSCEHCGLVWLNPCHHLSREAEHAHYAQHENDPTDPNYRGFLNRLWAPLKEKLTTGASGLDYGSGPGPTLHLMAQEDGFDCWHYDPYFHPDKSVFGQQYDFITCSETAEHFHDPAAEFRQLLALLKPGGWLGVMTSRLMPDTDFANWHYRRETTHVMFYRDATFEWMSDHWSWAKPEFVSNSIVLLQKT